MWTKLQIGIAVLMFLYSLLFFYAAYVLTKMIRRSKRWSHQKSFIFFMLLCCTLRFVGFFPVFIDLSDPYWINIWNIGQMFAMVCFIFDKLFVLGFWLRTVAILRGVPSSKSLELQRRFLLLQIATLLLLIGGTIAAYIFLVVAPTDEVYIQASRTWSVSVAVICAILGGCFIAVGIVSYRQIKALPFYNTIKDVRLRRTVVLVFVYSLTFFIRTTWLFVRAYSDDYVQTAILLHFYIISDLYLMAVEITPCALGISLLRSDLVESSFSIAGYSMSLGPIEQRNS